jgi:hypothetical protein
MCLSAQALTPEGAVEFFKNGEKCGLDLGAEVDLDLMPIII